MLPLLTSMLTSKWILPGLSRSSMFQRSPISVMESWLAQSLDRDRIFRGISKGFGRVSNSIRPTRLARIEIIRLDQHAATGLLHGFASLAGRKARVAGGIILGLIANCTV